MSTIVNRGREIAAKTATAYAVYGTAKSVSKLVANAVCHTWTINQDVTASEHDEAIDKVITDFRVELPWQRTHLEIGWDSDGVLGTCKDWTLLWIPTIGPVQVLSDGNVKFRTPTAAALTTLRGLVDEIAAEIEASRPAPVFSHQIARNTNLKSWNAGTGEWDYAGRRRAKSFSSVVLPVETQTDIESDLKRFTESRERLARVEMPWRRGYLLSGPPGTGKTSVSLAIAAVLGFEVARLPLSDIKSDGELIKAVAGIGGSTVLVIEDIDAYSISHDRDHNSARDGALSLSGLLNALDGFETPEGLVTIVTTNHIEKLDPALIRSGRLDRTFTLDYIDGPELERLFTWFYDVEAPGAAPSTTRAARLAPATIAELFKQHLNDPEGGWNAVLEVIPANNRNALRLLNERNIAV